MPHALTRARRRSKYLWLQGSWRRSKRRARLARCLTCFLIVRHSKQCHSHLSPHLLPLIETAMKAASLDRHRHSAAVRPTQRVPERETTPHLSAQATAQTESHSIHSRRPQHPAAQKRRQDNRRRREDNLPRRQAVQHKFRIPSEGPGGSIQICTTDRVLSSLEPAEAGEAVPIRPGPLTRPGKALDIGLGIAPAPKAPCD